MRISATNNYQMMSSYHREVEPTPMPVVVPSQGESYNEDIYNASNGNLINSKDGDIVLTPQGQTNLNNRQEENELEAAEADQAIKDNRRENGVDYIAHKSKQAQIEIYLSVATDSDVAISSNTTNMVEILRDVQKQNSAMNAYASYDTSQNYNREANF